MSIVESKTEIQQADILTQYIRDDRLHHAKNKEDSNLRKVLLGLAKEFIRFRDKSNLLYDEYDPRNTTDLITEWETQVGIPDGCFSNTGTLEERRVNILLKLTSINATTAEQFKNIASILGFNIKVSSGTDIASFPLTFPIVMLGAGEAPFTIIITLDESLQSQGFPLEFPITFSDPVPAILNCLFEKIKPAQCALVFRYGII